MQAPVLWCCDTESPLSFAAMYSAVSAYLLSHGRNWIWTILPDDAEAADGSIARLRRQLHWLGVDPDEVFAVTRQVRDCCCAAAAHFITGDRAYCRDVSRRRLVFFRLPETPELRGTTVAVGPQEVELQPNTTVEISRHGIRWCEKDSVMRRCSFAAMPGLILRRSDDGRELFNSRSRERARQLDFGKSFRFVGAGRVEYIGRVVVFRDSDGKAHRFPLERLSDPVLIDEAGRPSPLLLRVIVAIEEGATVLTGPGLDEAEAARLTLLFDAFGYPPPQFMLSPCPGGDAELPDYVSCRRSGLLADAVFQVLARLACGEPPAVELQPHEAWARRFRHRSGVRGSRRFEPERIWELNRKLLAGMPPEEFVRRAAPYALKAVARDPRFAELAKTKQLTTTVLSEAANWRF